MASQGEQAGTSSATADLPNLRLEAGCNIRDGVTSICRGRLGVQWTQHASGSASATDNSLNQSASARDTLAESSGDSDMLVTTNGGQVVAISLAQADRQIDVASQASSRCVMQRRWQWPASLSAAAITKQDIGEISVAACIYDGGHVSFDDTTNN